MSSPNDRSRSAPSLVVPVLLGSILVALVVLIVLVLVYRPAGPQATAGATSAQEPSRAAGPSASEPAAPPPPPKPVGDPERVRDVLVEGKTYESTLKAGLQGQVVDKDWGVRQTVNLAYVAEFRVRREVESNDGKTVVVLYHIIESRVTKLLSDVEVTLDLGGPGILCLAALDRWLTEGEGTEVVLEVAPVAEAILTEASQALLDEANARAKAEVDSLEGKRFRLTYVDGKGVVQLEPVDCTLTDNERAYLQELVEVRDCYLLPHAKGKPGEYWDVDARALVGMLPPTWRGRPSGVITVEREKDLKKGGKDYARLQITSGTFRVDASDRSRRRLGQVTPRGWLDYNITDGYIDHAELNAVASMEEVSTDHLLFEARFESTPRMEILYTCKQLETPAEP